MINYFQIYESNKFYHIYNHACGDKNLFNTHEDYIDFLEKYDKYFSQIFHLVAYCLMPNHFHFLIKVREESDVKFILINNVDSKAKEDYLAQSISLNSLIEDQYRRLYSAYAIKYNKKHNETGQLFLKKHKRISINEDTRLKHILCYIHHNPIHHKFKKDFNEWQYSSYAKYIDKNGIFEPWLNVLGGENQFLKIHYEFKIDKSDNVDNIDLI
jgi:putative transposase